MKRTEVLRAEPFVSLALGSGEAKIGKEQVLVCRYEAEGSLDRFLLRWYRWRHHFVSALIANGNILELYPKPKEKEGR